MNEDQYISPIIKAMMVSHELAQNAQKIKQQKEQAQAEHDLQQQRIDQEHEHFQEMLNKVHLPQIQAAGQLARLNAIKAVQEAHASGVDLSQVFPHGPTQGAENLPNLGGVAPVSPDLGQQTVDLSSIGLGTVPTSAFTSPEQLLKLKAQGIGAEESAKLGAQSPFVEAQKQRDFQRELSLNRQKNTFETAKVIEQGANQERVANIHGGYQIAAEREATAGRLEGIKIAHQLGMGDQDSEIANNLEDSVINGTTPYSALTADQKSAVESIAVGKGHIIPKIKGYNEALAGASQAQELLKQARDLANTYSSDSSGYTGPGSGVVNALKAKVPMSDVKTKMDSLSGQVNIVAKSFGINRTSNSEMDRLLRSMFDPTRTKAQNLQNVESAAKSLGTQVDSLFPKNIPAQQKNYVLGNRGITDFGGFKSSAPASTKITLKRDANGNLVEQ